MFNLFKKKKENFLVFIVEDNEVYLRQLSFFLEKRFGEKITLKSFKVAETALLELGMNPDIIIMDHFLNSKYKDAADGYTILQGLHKKHPNITLILHTSQPDVDFAIQIIRSDNCKYIAKNKEGFERIAETITSVISK